MTSMLTKKDWSILPRRALTPTEVVSRLATAPGWQLTGTGPDVTIAFVNAVAFIAHRQDHHPDLSVHYSRCVVRFSTHDVQGLTETDFECASQVDALLA
jgi:4a-hydroxytetrahydrobiopterin dehydratase